MPSPTIQTTSLCKTLTLNQSLYTCVCVCRGNSKYHYYGIRIKPDSPLSTFPTDDTELPTVAMRQPSQSSARWGSILPVSFVPVYVFFVIIINRNA